MVPQGSAVAPNDRGDLREQYRLAVEEYRFQVDLNWKRSEYYFVLNVAVLVAGVTLLSTSSSVPRGIIALVFLVGGLLALLSILANRTQHSYYRAARAVKQRLEAELDLGELALTTTPGMGSRLSRVGQVRTFLAIMLAIIVAVDGVGFGVSLVEAVDDAPPKVRALVHVSFPDRFSPRDATPLVVSRDRDVVTSRALDDDARALLSLTPGTYSLSIYATRFCSQEVEIRRRPLQVLQVNCSS